MTLCVGLPGVTLPTVIFFCSPVISMNYVVASFLALSGALIFSVEIPAQIDYVNHLARMHLLYDAAHGQLNPYYAVEWKLILNQACDLIVPQIARWTGVNIAMKL